MRSKIQGLYFEVSEPYKEGHTINTHEATALNQTRCENIGNNVRSEIRKVIGDRPTSEVTAKELDKLQKLVTQADNAYNFATSRSKDPLTLKTMALAKSTLKLKLNSAGISVKQYKANLAGYDPESGTLEEVKEGTRLYNEKLLEIANHPKVIEQCKSELETAANLNIAIT